MSSRSLSVLLLLCVGPFMAIHACAADFQVTKVSGTTPVVLYDGPSQKARPLFIYNDGVPVELISAIEGWSKVRDAQGTIGWIAKPQLADRRVLQVRIPVAAIRSQPSDSAPLVFEAEENVLLELDEAAASAAATVNPGWVRVRHRDGQKGYVRITSLFGL